MGVPPLTIMRESLPPTASHDPPPPLSVAPSKPQLPKLVLPKFKGDIKDWSAFWDSFKSAIHENNDIPKVDKFNYLKSLLEGTAFKTVQGLTLTNLNYDSAIQMLKERFGKPQQIISAHMEGLLKVSNCIGDRPGSLRAVYDKIMVHIRGLETTSEQYGSMLIPVIMTKFPSDIRLRIARETGGEAWKITPLLTTLRQEVEAREASEGSTINVIRTPVQPPRPPTNGTASSLVANSYNVHCVYCNASHFSASCDKVVAVKDCKYILIKKGRCFNCLKANHKTRECSSTKTCRLCHRKLADYVIGSIISLSVVPFCLKLNLSHLQTCPPPLQAYLSVMKRKLLQPLVRIMVGRQCCYRRPERLPLMMKPSHLFKLEFFLTVAVNVHMSQSKSVLS